MRAVRTIASALTLAAAAVLLTAAGEPRPASLLSAGDLDPALVLPPPPAPGSLQARAELAELAAMDAARTPDMLAAARSDSDTKNASIFAAAIGPGFELAKLPATARLMLEVRAAEKDVADRGKVHFRRNRPWVAAPALHHCGKDDDADWSSYPSGHTTMAYSMAGILTRLEPAHAREIMARAADYGQSRIVCEVHYRSDVTAGETLGLVVADRLMANSAFAADFAAEKSELVAAGL